ncbi:MAG: hypothetical protein IT373_24535 [Polyangiaceae bacterium]|nr:hypothetical protein [Polyangiaceae bacterium]
MNTTVVKVPVDRASNEVLRASRLLGTLTATADADLAALRKRQCPKVEVEQMLRVRDLCDALAAALSAPDPGSWRKLEACWRIVVEGTAEARALADLERADAAVRPGPKKERPSPERPAHEVQAVPRAGAAAAQATSAGARAAPARPARPPRLDEVLSTEVAPVAAAGSGDAPKPSPWVKPSAADRLAAVMASARSAAASALAATHGSAAGPPATGSGAFSPGSGADDIDATQGLDIRALNLEPLPFKEGRHVAPPPAALDGLAPVAASDLDGTGLLPAGSIVLEPVAPFPLTPPAPPPAPAGTPREGAGAGSVSAPPQAPVELTVQQLASLCASCAVHPDAARETEKHFGLPTPESRRALDEVWRARFRAEPALFQAFTAYFRAYQAWLSERASGGA